MHLTTLVEDTPGRADLRRRFGLSLWVETGGRNLLFDTGQDGSFLQNARTLGIDLGNTSLALLSHGHYDHGGGLGVFFREHAGIPFHLGEGAGEDYYGKVFGMKKYIGLDRSVLEQYRDQLRWVSRDTELASGIHALTPVAKPWPIPAGNRRLLMKTPEGLVPDTFRHELTCVVREKDGMVVLAGCGHSGILNMVKAAQDRFPGETVKAVVGGFHLIDNPFLKTMGASPSEVRNVAHRLDAMGCRRVITGHCTGKKAARILSEELGERLEILHTGSEFDI
ncbi:MAG: MBL fold metallo-hydrolase [Methanomicrobiales archaeon]|nr:MBL fold metallo-hydrolase [Methanomicrobiales archaeon]